MALLVGVAPATAALPTAMNQTAKMAPNPWRADVSYFGGVLTYHLAFFDTNAASNPTYNPTFTLVSAPSNGILEYRTDLVNGNFLPVPLNTPISNDTLRYPAANSSGNYNNNRWSYTSTNGSMSVTGSIDQFTWKMANAEGESGVGTCTIQITTNQPPAVNDLYRTCAPGTATTFSVDFYDPDLQPWDTTLPRAQPWTAVVVTPPSYGTLTTNGICLTYTPNGGSTQAWDSFTFKVNDSADDSNLATAVLQRRNSANRASNLVILVVSDTLLPAGGISNEVYRLKGDLEREGYTARVQSWHNAGSTASNLWAYLVSEYTNPAQFLAGAVLIGDLPVGSVTNGASTRYTDLVFWNLKYFQTSWVNNPPRNIWVSRIVSPGTNYGSEITMLRRALDANHDYRTGASRLPHTAFAYCTAVKSGLVNDTNTVTRLKEVWPQGDFRGGPSGTNKWFLPERTELRNLDGYDCVGADCLAVGGEIFEQVSDAEPNDILIDGGGRIFIDGLYHLVNQVRFHVYYACDCGCYGGFVNNLITTRGGGCVLAVASSGTGLGSLQGEYMLGQCSLEDTSFRQLLKAGESMGAAAVQYYAFRSVYNDRTMFYGDLSLGAMAAPSNSLPVIRGFTQTTNAGYLGFAVDAYDPDGTVSSIEWFLEGYDYGRAAPTFSGAATNVAYAYPATGVYTARVEVIDGYKARTWREMVVTVTSVLSGPVTILVDPQSSTNNPGSAASFMVTASGTAPLNYQWQKNATNITAATNASYTIAAVASNDAGGYRCVVSNALGAATSGVATLTVNAPAAISAEPQSLTNNPGTPANFTVTASGTAPLYYQWQKNATNIALATNAAYAIASVAAGDAGSYRCLVSNLVNAVTSGVATLSVNGPATVIGEPQSLTNNPGSAASFTVTAAGTAPLYYQWQKNTTNIAAATNASYAIAAVAAGDAGSYRCLVSNVVNVTTSAAATLSVNAPAAITADPQSLTNNPGAPANFTVTASGTGPLYYQWQKNATNINLATNASYAIGSVAAGDAGSYRCLVSNMVNAVTSAVATLSVNGPATIIAEPQSLTNNPGTAANFTVAASGTAPLYYQWQKNATNISLATNASYAIGSVAAGDAGSYRCLVSNIVNVATSATAWLAVNTPAAIGADPQSRTNIAGSSASFTVTASGTAPLRYQWQKNATNITLATNATYTIAAVAAGDAGSYRCLVSNMVNAATSAAATLTVNVSPTFTVQPQARAVDPGAAVVFSVTAAGTDPLGYQWQKDGAAIAGARAADYAIAAAAQADEGSYACVVSNVAGSVTSAAAALLVNDPPAITAQPQARTAAVGAPVTFSVGASGTAPLVYRWQKDGLALPDGTAADFTLAAVALSDAGAYRCLVSNSAGTALSAAAALTVTSAPPVAAAAPGRVADDYDGDGKADPAVFEAGSGTWLVWLSRNEYRCYAAENFLGGTGDVPAAADYDGDRLADPCVYRGASGTWVVRLSALGYAQQEAAGLIGGPEAWPAPADYDGDRLADPAVCEAASGKWQVRLSGSGYAAVELPGLGGSGWAPAQGDYDGDGKADPGVYREEGGDWLVLLSSGGYTQVGRAGLLGGVGYLAVPADFDGDGKADPAVMHPASGQWCVLLSGSDYAAVIAILTP
jgi:hypothetical protein